MNLARMDNPNGHPLPMPQKSLSGSSCAMWPAVAADRPDTIGKVSACGCMANTPTCTAATKHRILGKGEAMGCAAPVRERGTARP